LNEIVAACPHNRPKVLLETTAGQGSSIGHTFEQIAAILALLDRPRRFGVCLDTSHVFAAGYDIRSPEAYRRTMDEFDGVIGQDRLKAIHLNDSVRDIGSHIDRHAHIGRGKIGLTGFRNFVNDGRLAEVPMILETPKGKDASGRDWDQINAETIRGLAGFGERPLGPFGTHFQRNDRG
jgi:deoxyribonuclease-4